MRPVAIGLTVAAVFCIVAWVVLWFVCRWLVGWGTDFLETLVRSM